MWNIIPANDHKFRFFSIIIWLSSIIRSSKVQTPFAFSANITISPAYRILFLGISFTWKPFSELQDINSVDAFSANKINNSGEKRPTYCCLLRQWIKIINLEERWKSSLERSHKYCHLIKLFSDSANIRPCF